MSQEKNIFETASKQLGHKKSDSTVSKQKPPSPQTSYKDSETQEMLNKIKEMKEDLRNKVEMIKKKAGPGVIKKILEGEYPLMPQDRDKIELAKKLLRDKVSDTVGKAKPSEAVSAKPTDRKAKTRGARKKWIPMR